MRWSRRLFAMLMQLTVGCAALRDFPAPTVSSTTKLYDAQTEDVRESDHPGSSIPCDPLNVLVLSGGGMNGSYQAGVLKGWSESGTRPQFDVVTGISAGGLIAPFAFAGTEYDAALERGAGLRARDIYRLRPPASLPWSDSVADSGPLRQHIQKEVTPDLLTKIAEAHSAGRRLYVGTTNLDSKRLVVWNMGAIASKNTPESFDLFRKVLLASCSVPGLLPPVSIDVVIDGRPHTELHVDGGVSASLFLHPQMFNLATEEPTSPSRTVHIILAGKLSPEAAPVKRGIFQVSGASISGLMQAQLDGDLLRVYLATVYGRSQFALTAIPQDFDVGTSAMELDGMTMQRLFDEGKRFSLTGGSWREAPPGLASDEYQIPRQSTRMVTSMPEWRTSSWKDFGERDATNCERGK